jgi:outer membrane murein-binding lipoprotein Lpp
MPEISKDSLPTSLPASASSPSTPSSTPTIASTIAGLKKQLSEAESALEATKAKAAAARPPGELRVMIPKSKVIEILNSTDNFLDRSIEEGRLKPAVKIGPRCARHFLDEVVDFQAVAACERDVKWLRARLERAEQEAARAARQANHCDT